jgi:hypothetical protein
MSLTLIRATVTLRGRVISYSPVKQRSLLRSRRAFLRRVLDEAYVTIRSKISISSQLETSYRNHKIVSRRI